MPRVILLVPLLLLVATNPSGLAMFIQLLTPRHGAPLELTRLNVVLGANQSGKSTVLRDIFRLATGREPHSTTEAVPDVETSILSDMQFGGAKDDDQFSKGPANPLDSSLTSMEGLAGDLRGVVRASLKHEAWNVIKRPVLHARSVLETELPDVMLMRTVYLDEKNLNTAANTTSGRRPLEPARDLLQLLQFADSEAHAELDAAFASAFPPQGLRLDDSQVVQLTLRLGDEFPEECEDRIANALAWSQLPALDSAGRGARNFATIALSVLMLRGRIIIADEPDAALEPFAARQLGRWLATAAVEYDCQLIVSSRSTSLAAGMQERSGELTVIHTRHAAGETHLGAVSPQELKAISASPLLFVDECLSAMRRLGVILIEDPLEAAAYQALNAHRGGADRWKVICIHSISQAAPFLRMLRHAGVPAALLGRLTHLEVRDLFRELLDAACLGHTPTNWLSTRDQLARNIAKIRDTESAAHTHAMEEILEKLGTGQTAPAEKLPELQRDGPWQRVAREGLAAIPVDQRSWVEQLLEELKSAGLFIGTQGATEDLRPAVFVDLMKAIQTGQTPERMAITLTEVVQYLRTPATVST